MAEVYHFHVNVVARPQTGSFAVTWEEVAAALQKLPRMLFEPDGSFVCNGDAGRQHWQLDGYLFDFAGRLHRMELHGACPPEQFDELLRTVGWPQQPLAFEMVREGVTLDENEFRSRVASEEN